MSLERVRNWDVRLAMAARELVGAPFAWGRTDCGSLCRVTLDALYGQGTGERSLGRPYRDVRGAARRWKRLGGVAIIEELGGRPIARPYMSIGDVLVIPGEDEDVMPRLAVALGTRWMRVTRTEGVLVEPTATLPSDAQAWRLP